MTPGVRVGLACVLVVTINHLLGAPDRLSSDRSMLDARHQIFLTAVRGAILDARLFAPTSPWNLLATGPADHRSDLMIADLSQAAARQGLLINTERYAVPIRRINQPTPSVPVRPSTTWWSGMNAPMPDDARPDPGSDRHLVIWDTGANLLYEFWRLERTPTGWIAGYGVVFDAGGSGIQTTPNANSARAYGGSLAAGAIRYEEILNGWIPHALAFAYPTTRGDRYAFGPGPGGVMAIATHADNDRSPNRITDANIPLGARFRLRSDIDVAARCGANRACLILGRALQESGAYVVDTAAVPVFFAENVQDRGLSWDGLLTPGDLRVFQAQDYEVLALPPLSPAF